uniref:DED domain-containing protein n=1 Tax=Biomphalaria glabrata TaxID=6526 RepID=A0A2C9M8S9_BIOGL
MGTEDRQIAYRAMIVELSSKLTDKELGSMKFMCKEIIPNRVRDSLATSLHLFEALEERNKLSATNLEFLKHLLKTGCNKREDVLLIVENFERGNVRIVNQCIQQAMDIDTHPMQESGRVFNNFHLLFHTCLALQLYFKQFIVFLVIQMLLCQ